MNPQPETYTTAQAAAPAVLPHARAETLRVLRLIADADADPAARAAAQQAI